MARIPQAHLFDWRDLDDLGDLERLRLVLDHLPDEVLMCSLEAARGYGRDDYPVRAMWNSILAGVVYQHVSIESLRRELSRNAQLRQVCGFDPLAGQASVPTSWAYTRFVRSLFAQQSAIDTMFDELVEQLRASLPNFGRVLAMDGKAIASHANRRKKGVPCGEADGRRDVDANVGVKTYKGKRQDGTPWEKVTSWFGYKLHLIVDAEYELPVAYEVTKASASEITQGRKLVAKLASRHAELVDGCYALAGDRGLDDTQLITSLWDEHHVRPVIDIRNGWQDGKDTRLVPGYANVMYDYRGTVFCRCALAGERRRMAFAGFEEDRQTLKYRCPAAHYGCHCKSAECCAVGRSVRVKLDVDRRVFTPLARSSCRWKDMYKKRTAVERVNSRLDVSFGFERHFIRGQRKMQLRMGLSLVVMLAMALGRVKEKEKPKLRSLVQAA